MWFADLAAQWRGGMQTSGAFRATAVCQHVSFLFFFFWIVISCLTGCYVSAVNNLRHLWNLLVFPIHVLPQQPWLLTMSSLDFQSNVFHGKQRSPVLQWKGVMSPVVICGCCQCCCTVMLVSCSSSRWRCWPNICPTFFFFPITKEYSTDNTQLKILFLNLKKRLISGS